jgi:curved DNA-binding protein
MQYHDYYKTLDVERSATESDIKSAYRKAARKYHPDVSDDPNAEERFKEVGEAYEVLKDPEKRAAFDQLGANWKTGQDFRPPSGWGGGVAGGQPGAGGDAFSDFFREMFGERGGAGAAGFRPRPRKGADQSLRVTVGLGEAYTGSERAVTLSDGRTLKVKIPKGVIPGQKIRLSGQGGRAEGAPSGDLYLEIDIGEHPWLRLDGRDISLELPITPWEAALGAVVKVPTLGGAVDLKIPAGSQSGQKLRLKGRGLSSKSASGDQYVTFKMVTPAPESDEDRELYETMAKQMSADPRAELGNL